MRRVLWQSPGLTLHSFSVLLSLAVVAGLALTVWRARRERLSTETVLELAVWLLSGGIIGARGLYILTHPQSIQTFSDIFKIWQGGIVYYGCLIGGLIGSTLYWFRRPFPFLAMADAVAPALALGSTIGRLGCWFNGCCYGQICEPGWGVAFPAGSIPWARHVSEGLIPPSSAQSLHVLPTQLYAVLDGFLILAVLSVYYPRRKRDGEVMAVLMLTYSVTRFVMETLRADEGAILLGLTLSQSISVAVFLGGLALRSWLASRPPWRWADADDASNRDAVIGQGVLAPELSALLGRSVRHDRAEGFHPASVRAPQQTDRPVAPKDHPVGPKTVEAVVHDRGEVIRREPLPGLRDDP